MALLCKQWDNTQDISPGRTFFMGLSQAASKNLVYTEESSKLIQALGIYSLSIFLNFPDFRWILRPEWHIQKFNVFESESLLSDLPCNTLCKNSFFKEDKQYWKGENTYFSFLLYIQWVSMT